jgi:hypothetical protein
LEGVVRRASALVFVAVAVVLGGGNPSAVDARIAAKASPVSSRLNVR